MLVAEKTSAWRNAYDLSEDGRHLARWAPSWWKTGGTIELDGQPYVLAGNGWGTRFQLLDRSGGVIAAAERVGRKNWTVRAGDQTYRFRRASWWGGNQELLVGDQAVGSIRKTSFWRGSAVADLPGLAPPVRVFVVCVVLAMWAAEASAAASAGGSG